jgi:Arc/MetJ-type ribon-helix-helix transcriptional regulator
VELTDKDLTSLQSRIGRIKLETLLAALEADDIEKTLNLIHRWRGVLMAAEKKVLELAGQDQEEVFDPERELRLLTEATRELVKRGESYHNASGAIRNKVQDVEAKLARRKEFKRQTQEKAQVRSLWYRIEEDGSGVGFAVIAVGESEADLPIFNSKAYVTEYGHHARFGRDTKRFDSTEQALEYLKGLGCENILGDGRVYSP